MDDSQKVSITVRPALWRNDREVLSSIRTRVFVDEQRVPVDDEYDGRDSAAIHFVALADDEPVGTVRLEGKGKIGRLAVLPHRRGLGIGRKLFQAALEAARRLPGSPEIYIHAQSKAAGFYLDFGFTVDGEPFMEAGIEHVKMSPD